MEVETIGNKKMGITISTKIFLGMIVFAVMLLIYLLFTESGKKALWNIADEIIKKLVGGW